MDNLTFHDLRRTGQTLAAQTGATLADLMKRLGRSSMAAARRYLHAVDGRDPGDRQGAVGAGGAWRRRTSCQNEHNVTKGVVCR